MHSITPFPDHPVESADFQFWSASGTIRTGRFLPSEEGGGPVHQCGQHKVQSTWRSLALLANKWWMMFQSSAWRTSSIWAPMSDGRDIDERCKAATRCCDRFVPAFERQRSCECLRRWWNLLFYMRRWSYVESMSQSYRNSIEIP